VDTTTLLAGSAARPSARSGAARPLSLLVGGLLATVHVTLSMWWGWVPFTTVLTLLALGVGLVPLFLLGLPVLVLAVLVAGWFGAAERARLAAVLGVHLPGPAPRRRDGQAGPWARGRSVLGDGARWRAVAWCLLVPVLGTVEGVLVLALWSAAAALLALPLWRGAVPADGWLGRVPLTGAVGGVAAGLLLVAVALVVARGCAACDVALARVLLGPSRRAALAERVEQLTATRSGVVDAADAERRRIERDLHDGAQQRLVALAVDLGMASAKLERAGADGGGGGGAQEAAAARELVARAHAEAKQALVELRDLARGIHPAVLTDRGLDAALSALAARSPVPVDVDVRLDGRCSATVEATAYFVVAEALTNVAKHARATRARVTVRRARALAGGPPDGADRLVVTVSDDGRGGADPATGTGLAGLARRVAGADGTVHLSSPAGGPTELRVEIPCAS
jgi:signal transduction histidine kinase